jgi:plasmid stabilization system protein ParE
MDNPRAAKIWFHKIRDRIRRAGRSPRLGRKVPEFERDDVREAIVGSYRVVYVIEAKAVVVQTIMEGHHLLPDLES